MTEEENKFGREEELAVYDISICRHYKQINFWFWHCFGGRVGSLQSNIHDLDVS